MRILLFCAAAALVVGCSHQPKRVKSSVHVYEGDSPTIHMQETQTAGGPLQTY